MTYFWFDQLGWWWGDPERAWGGGPYDTFERMMYRYRIVCGG